MAQVGDIQNIFKQIGTMRVLKRLFSEVSADNLTTLGASLAYSWLFALFPFLVFLLGLIPLTPTRYKPGIVKQVGDALERVLTHDAAGPLKEQVKSLLNAPTGGLLSFSLLLTIYGASKGMSMTMSTIDLCYNVKNPRPFVKQQLLAFGLTIVIATLVLLVMILLPIGTGVLFWLQNYVIYSKGILYVINIGRYVVALGLLFVILSIIYYFGPTERRKFIWVTPGAVFTVIIWLILGVAFQTYLTRFGGAQTYQKTYGAVAGAAILLIVFYFDALVLLIGAEINSELDLWLQEMEKAKTDRPEELTS